MFTIQDANVIERGERRGDNLARKVALREVEGVRTEVAGSSGNATVIYNRLSRENDSRIDLGRIDLHLLTYCLLLAVEEKRFPTGARWGGGARRNNGANRWIRETRRRNNATSRFHCS